MSHLFGRAPNGLHHHKARRSPLPFNHGSSALNEKLSLDGEGSDSHTLLFVPLPFSNPRRKVRLSIPIPSRVGRRLLRPRSLLVLLGGLVLLIWLLGKSRKKQGDGTKKVVWQNPFTPSTSVFSKEEIKSVWEWEVMSGHHPSARKFSQMPLPNGYLNPALPYSPSSRFLDPSASTEAANLTGSGPTRLYVDLSTPRNPREQTAFGFPRRPAQGSAADLDILFSHCDFPTNYVRDCLEVLRVGGQLDNGRRIKRGDLSPWSYVYTEDFSSLPEPSDEEAGQRAQLVLGIKPLDTSPKTNLDKPHLSLPPPYPPRPPTPTVDQPCDPNRPRLFHIFWAGPFTDKPYMAIMSFLYTQNLGLDTPISDWSTSNDPPVCRPQFLVWINPGHAASVPNPSAKREMYEALATNPWSAPFLHPRFRDVIKFKMWNTTEQLDGVPELRDRWRTMPILNSGGTNVTPPDKKETDEEEELEEALSDEELLKGVVADLADAQGAGKPYPAHPAKQSQKVSLGAKEEDYDKLSTVLSDMVRFVLLHRFGGVYLDADTLLLRDWEELWNWRGAWAYRWSHHDKYNTALIKLHKGSALTSFIFKTALENGMDFHPMTISRYLADAGLDPLLYRIPDAILDSAWINMENYQRDRPPFPHFDEFKEFFVGSRKTTAAPQPAGYDSFFRGAFAYHWHNNWWYPFDPSRNWPDLGPRFSRGEKLLREAIAAAKKPFQVAVDDGPVDTAALAAKEPSSRGPGGLVEKKKEEDGVEDDERDLSWSTVLKRTMEGFVRGERPNQYGEWISWD